MDGGLPLANPPYTDMRPPSLHDALFKQFLSDPATAHDFLEIHLPEPLRKLCDLSTLRMEPGTYLEENLRAHYSDILYSVGTSSGNKGYLYTLIEHQSTPDKLMAFRLMRYAVSVMNNHLIQGHDRLPLVGPLDDAAQPSLWLCAGLGARGLSFSALCAELLVAWLGGEPLPIENTLAKLLATRRAHRGKGMASESPGNPFQ